MTKNHAIKSIGLALGLGVIANLEATTVSAQDIQTITVAGGCFWCVESDFESVDGVLEVISGYTGGSIENPNYNDVTSGSTGHYEAVQIQFDHDQISEREIYDLFFRSIDPFDETGQFCDRGDSYRTAIFVSNPAQDAAAEAAKSAAESELGQPVVTPILAASVFFEAEEYHQNYYSGEQRVITRRGIKTQADAYAFYRNACGRDQRVEAVWGSDAPFIKH